MPSRNYAAPRHGGFTLLEVMITVAIVGILAAIALPSYTYFITRSRVIEATTALGDMRSQMEKYFMDNRTYLNAGKCAVDTVMTAYNTVPSNHFQLSCPGGTFTATTYIVQADGIGPMAGFSYTINQLNQKATLSTSWGPVSGNCWVSKKDGTCL